MESYVCGSSEETDALADALTGEARALIAVCRTASASLDRLSESCRDDGFERMSARVQTVARQLGSLSPELLRVIDKLRAYSAFLSEHGAADGAGGVVGGVKASMEPDRRTPRALSASQYGFHPDGKGGMVYDAPVALDRYLYGCQGSADPSFKGTCGLCSCANLLRMAGVPLGEKDMIDYAAPNGLCLVVPNAGGGTTVQQRRLILEHFGIESDLIPVPMSDGTAEEGALETIANATSEGRGVILSVYAGVLYRGCKAGNDYHAVVVTSVAKDKDGAITGFYICDSNRGTSFYKAETIREALTGRDMNITKSILR